MGGYKEVQKKLIIMTFGKSFVLTTVTSVTFTVTYVHIHASELKEQPKINSEVNL